MSSAFNDDPMVERECARLIERYAIEHIIETGTYKGTTTRFFSSFGIPVDTIEIDQTNFSEASASLRDASNVTVHIGNSVSVLQTLIPKLPSRTLFYLDAHWHSYWPLRDELTMIREHLPQAVIIIDDFKTPFRNYNFDCYIQGPCDINYVRDVLPNTCTYYYLNKTLRVPTGVGKLFVVPDTPSDLVQLENGVLFSTTP